ERPGAGSGNLGLARRAPRRTVGGRTVNSLRQPIFIVGCPRSGTTLVQCILSASSQAFSLPETHFFSSVLPAVGAVPEAGVARPEILRGQQAFETQAELT